MSQFERVLYLNGQQPGALEWTEPDRYDLTQSGDRRQMYGREIMQLATKHGRAAIIANELFDLHHPDYDDEVDHGVQREDFVSSITRRGDRYGNWFYFPWSNRLVQYPEQEDHQALLTARNRELISSDEQQKLRRATILFAGLNAGMKVLDEVTHMGMGDRLVLADPDTVSIRNLNRLNVGMGEVGIRKTDVAAMRVSELNPYVKLHLYPDGITKNNIDTIMRHGPNLLYEHADNLQAKLLLRNTARQAELPLVMATDIGDRSLIDVERYDKSGTEPFLQRLNALEIEMIQRGGLSTEQTMRMIAKIIGYENISVRTAQSLGRIGLTLGGIAQLGTTASAGGAYAAIVGREIILGKGPGSGRYHKPSVA